MTGFEWLVVIISVILGFFLLMGLYLMWRLKDLLKQLRRITTKAEQVTDDVKIASGFFKQASGPATISKYIANIIDGVKSPGRKK